MRSSPIKGTAPVAAELLAKDRAENVMIVDLVRNDLGRVCEWGSVQVPSLLAVEEHPGLVHLVSTVEGRLRPGVGWPELIAATFPPGSVTGAPKLAALDHIARLEPCPRGVYCGAVGWVDADRTEGSLNVAIRTFWFDGGPHPPRDRRRHHLGLHARRRVGGDRAQGPPAAPGGQRRARGAPVDDLGVGRRRAHAWRTRAGCSALDHAVTVGDGVFETMKVVDGEPFAMRRHLRRLRTSAAVLGLEIGRSDDELRGGVRRGAGRRRAASGGCASP